MSKDSDKKLREILKTLEAKLHFIDITCNFSAEEQEMAEKLYDWAISKIKKHFKLYK